LKKKVLALCDTEKDYLQQLTDYLQKKEDFPFEIHAYTEPEGLVAYESGRDVEVLMVSEQAYTYEVSRLDVGQVLVLGDGGKPAKDGVIHVDKYRRAEDIYKQLVDCFLEKGEEVKKTVCVTESAKVIGFYSPIRRCLQTSFALTMGQILSANNKVLYISFEHYAGWNGLLRKEGGKDLSDLLGYLEEEDKFYYRIRSVERKIGNLWYIPPVYVGQNLVYITGQQWVKLIGKIAACGGFDYLVLDLSEGLQGIFDILRICDRIYTIVCDDKLARGKMEQYEHLLRLQEYEDVLEKTHKQKLPHMQEMPGQLDRYTRGELVAFARELIKRDLEVTEDDGDGGV